MITFSVLDKSNAKKLASEFRDTEYAIDVLSSMNEVSSEGIEVAVCGYCGLLLFRIYDGEYLFVYPVEVDSAVRDTDALLKISEYALWEEIGLTFTDVPEEELEYLNSVFKRTEVLASDGEVSTVCVNSAFFEMPKSFCVKLKSAEITRIKNDDKDAYKRLNNDENVNKYWGFVRKNEELKQKPEYFIDEIKREEDRQASVTLAVRRSGEFIGELQFFRFDYALGVEISIRIFKEHWGAGIAKEVVTWAIEYLKSNGVKRLNARVKIQNEASIRLFSSLMSVKYEEDGIRYFSLEL